MQNFININRTPSYYHQKLSYRQFSSNPMMLTILQNFGYLVDKRIFQYKYLFATNVASS